MECIIIVVLFIMGFEGRVSLCYSHGCARTRSVNCVSLELLELRLPLPPESWD